MYLYGSGYTTGISVDLGYDIIEINPAYEGGLLTYARLETYFSGGQLSDYVYNSLLRRGIDLGEKRHIILEDIKRQALSVPPISPSVCPIIKYKLPWGKVIDISKEMHCAAELIFHPESIENAHSGILPLPEAVVSSASKCDEDLQDELFGAVVVTGGLSAIPGLRQRLAYELERIVNMQVNIPETPEPYTVAWLGAAVYAGMEDSKKVWVQKRQYEEYGEKIVRNKFV